jgi:hypothetical protein
MTEPEINIFLNQITFALPCQSFDINYSVTKQERLPIVTEFVVRLIHVCNGISVFNIQEYFGFSSKETEVVIQSLKNERLVLFNTDNELELTEYAKSKFAESSDELPRFFKIEEKNETINFNLISFSFLKKLGSNYPNSLLINLKEKDDHISKSKYYAEKSFGDNFNKIKDKIEEKSELYKITNVSAKNRYNYPIPLNFYLKFDDDIIDVVNSKDTEELIKSDNGVYKEIIEIFSNRNDFVSRYRNQSKYLLEFVRIFKDRLLNNKINSENELDLINYIKEVHLQKIVSYESGTDALLGNLYIRGDENKINNFSKIIETLSKYEKHHKSMCWLAPENSYFGRTCLLKDFINAIVSKKSKNELKILLPVEDGQQDYIYSNSFETYGYIKPIMNGQLEILLYAPYFVCVLFHYHYPTTFSSISIPIGFVSENPEKVEIARKLISEHLQNNKNYQGKLGRNKNKENNFKDDFCFLNLSSSTPKASVQTIG